MAFRAIWSGSLGFGLVNFPVKLYSSVDENDIHLNQLHRTCGQRIKMPRWCPDCDKQLETAEIVKGYPMGDGYVHLEDADFETLPVKTIKAIEVVEFVAPGTLDPRHYDKAYFLAPDKAGTKAFALLLKGMEQAERVAVARLTMRQREHLCTIRPYQEGDSHHPLFLLQTLFYADELRDAQPLYGKLPEVSAEEQTMAVQLIEAMVGEADMSKYQDEYQMALTQLIEAKFAGEEIKVSPVAEAAPTTDIMAGLLASIEAAKSGSEAWDVLNQPDPTPEPPPESESLEAKLRRLGVGA